MSVKSTKTFLTIFKDNSQQSFIKNLVYQKIKFEVLNPIELGPEWESVEFIKSDMVDNQDLLTKTDKILQTYQPTGFLNSFVDHRPEVDSKDVHYIDNSKDRPKILDIINHLDKFENYNTIEKELAEIVQQNPDKSLLIGHDILPFKEKLDQFTKEVIEEFITNHPIVELKEELHQIDFQHLQNYGVLLFDKEELDYILDYKKAEHDEIKLYNHKDFLVYVREQKLVIIKHLKEFSFNPEKISKDNYLLLCSIYASLEMEHILYEASNLVFKLSSDKADEVANYAFISVHPEDVKKFENLAVKNEIAIEATQWSKEIVVWNRGDSVTPFKNVAQSLGTIGNKETDPSLAITVFFSLFFAFCLGDALYGLVLAVFCGYFIFFKNLKTQFQSIFQLFFIAGVATVIFGALFNSWAGDLFLKTPLNPIFESIQLINPLDPLSKAPVNQFLLERGISPIVALLGFSAAIGFVTLMAAYLIKIMNTLKAKDYGAFFEETNWFVFILFGVLALFASSLPAAIGTVIMGLFAVSGLAFFVTNSGKGLFGKVLGGLAKFYNLIGFGSDLLSFTRLIAVGLTGGIIATVINLLAFLIYNSIPVPVLNLLLTAAILVIGHLFNLTISLFGAYINPLRLHYVEFLPKFYEPSGQKLNFIKTDFKYLKLKN